MIIVRINSEHKKKARSNGGISPFFQRFECDEMKKRRKKLHAAQWMECEQILIKVYYYHFYRWQRVDINPFLAFVAFNARLFATDAYCPFIVVTLDPNMLVRPVSSHEYYL